MSNFQKFDNDILFLLAQNKFNDSRMYYEEHKQELKSKAIVPMRNLASDLIPQLQKIDDKMNLIPTKMVSRIVRDTRFSKNKTLYRDNVWCMFMRPKNEWRYQSCMWFEYTPAVYSLGVGFFNCEPKVMAYFRKALQDAENQKRFINAILSLEKFGALPCIECYKKDKEGIEQIADNLKVFYNAKEFYFIMNSDKLEHLFDGTLYERVSKGLEAFAPMYIFLQEIIDKMIQDKLTEI